ncbi:MAG: phosphotransferase family protein [Actinomycetota bacterium]|nr:phosphotransferase family protein [Actinomycetota bacterium]
MSERASSERASSERASPGGLDVERIGSWLEQHCGLRPPVHVEVIAGGRSNLTSVVTDAEGRRVVVRRPPLSGVLASAHDVVREGRIMAALCASAVPVPEVLGVEDDAAFTGAPFVVTAHVDGVVVRDRTVASQLSVPQRAALGRTVVDALAAIHEVDVDVVGLGDLARRDGYFARQVARWSAQLDAGSDRPLPALAELGRALAAAVPEQDGLALVHGDFRLDNLIVDLAPAGAAPAGAQVRAVLDWELATLGDPLADVGTLLAYWGVPARDGQMASVLVPDLPTALEGFSGPGELVALYAAARGLDAAELAERLRPYLAFAWFRIACILEGVRVRTVTGAYGAMGDPARRETALLETLVPSIGERALAVLTRPGPLGFDHELT